jgi:hypothetical protein
VSSVEVTDAWEGAGLGGWPFFRLGRRESGAESDSELVVSRGGEDGSDFLDCCFAFALLVCLAMTATFRNRVRL